MLQAINDVLDSLTPQVDELIKFMQAQSVELFDRDQLQMRLGLSDRKSFRVRYLKPALDLGLIEMTRPDKPNSRLQQYRLTKLSPKV